MYESTTSTCVLCLSISKMKDILSTTLSSDSPDITSQTAVSCSDYGHTPFVYASNLDFKIMPHSSSLNNLQIKPWPTADYHYTMVNNSAWMCNFVQQYLGSVHELNPKEFAQVWLP